MNNNVTFRPMSDYELEKFCESNPDCGCKCMKCPAFAANQRYNNGYESGGRYEKMYKRVLFL